MDDLVKAALAKWPNVPAVYGWLSLTARGEWRIKGEAIENDAIRAFIGRNYANNGGGHWFFQNGPQRVYVSLDLAPFIYRLDGLGRLVAHNDVPPRELQKVFADESGRLYFQTELGPGALDDRDLLAISVHIVDRRGTRLNDEALEAWEAADQGAYFAADGINIRTDGICRIERVAATQIADVLGFTRDPQAS